MIIHNLRVSTWFFVLWAIFSVSSIQAQRLHKAPTLSEQQRLSFRAKNKTHFYKAFPANFRLPGEFEASQAVLISWAFQYDDNGIPTGLDFTAPYGTVSAELCDAIQPECAVWIRVLSASDTTAVIQFMKDRNTPLFHYRFFVATGDDWWTRDYGPMAFYYDSDDKLGFCDLKYYDGRDNDDVLNRQIAREIGIENFETTLNAEGGNLMTDGYGTLFFSTMIDDENTDATIHSPAWSISQINDTMKRVLGCSTLVRLTSLNCDGGTGHIDMYVKLLDEQTIVAMYYPSAVTASDKQIIEDNLQLLTQLKSTYNRPFRILRFEMPTDDNGTYSLKTCKQIDADARTFINGTTVNKTMIFPSFYDGKSGNASQHARTLQRYKDLLPGYSIKPIDSRDITPLGGAIHCITMQIPASDPILIWHPSLDWVQPIQSSYAILAKISNHTGVDSAYCIWRKNTGDWNVSTLTDSSGFWVGNIMPGNLLASDSIEYYIKALSHSGKWAYKPFGAPQGFYTMYFQAPSGIKPIDINDYVFGVYPNPATNQVNLQWQLRQSTSHLTLQVFDMQGKKCFEKQTGNTASGMGSELVDIQNWPAGLYIYQVRSGEKVLGTRKFIVRGE